MSGTPEHPSRAELSELYSTAEHLGRAADDSKQRLFPYNSVVGVIDTPTDLKAAIDALVGAGFSQQEVDVLSGQAGIDRIDEKGEHKGLRGRLFRIIDALGEEREHTQRHVEALRAGFFLVVVPVPDDGAKERARVALADHGAHFINYYTRWTAENLRSTRSLEDSKVSPPA